MIPDLSPVRGEVHGALVCVRGDVSLVEFCRFQDPLGTTSDWDPCLRQGLTWLHRAASNSRALWCCWSSTIHAWPVLADNGSCLGTSGKRSGPMLSVQSIATGNGEGPRGTPHSGPGAWCVGWHRLSVAKLQKEQQEEPKAGEGSPDVLLETL